jgi:MoaA/NifB/PqqE/SkfB family radical SAM enzyme
MSIILKADPDNIGQYFAFFTGKYLLNEVKDIDKKSISTVFADKSFSNVLKNTELKIVYKSKKEIKELIQKTDNIPKWIQHEENFDFVSKKEWLKIKPVTAEFIPTLNCNFHCNQCSYSIPKQNLKIWKKGSKKPAQRNIGFDMDQKTAITIINKLAKENVKNLLITGGGEPFMNPVTTLESIRYAKLKGLNVGIYSNGSLLNKQIIQNIIKNNPLFIRISIYGTNPNDFSTYTNQNKIIYTKVINNIKELAKEKIKQKSNTQIGLSFLIHPHTQKNFDEINNYLLKKLSHKELQAINTCRFTPAVNYFGKKQHSQAKMEKIFSYIEKNISPRLEKHGILVKLYFHRLNDLNKTKTYKKCLASGWFLEIGPRGDVFLCCEKLFLTPYKIGNILSQSIKEIYQSNLRKNIIKKVCDQDCKNCPTLCKPHELNKIFNNHNINKLTPSQILNWKNSILNKQEKQTFFPGKLNDFES